MASITIPDVPEAVRAELAARATRSGRSLEDHLRAELVGLARGADPQELVERIRARKLRTDSQLDTATILAHRDAGRR